MTDHSSSFYRPGTAPPAAAEAPAARRARLSRFAPEAAVRAWLDGDFGFDDEDVLCDAIRRDPDVTLTDDEIETVFMNVFERGARPDEAPAVLTLLREAAQFRMP